MHFHISIIHEGSLAVVFVRGALDRAGAGRLDDALTRVVDEGAQNIAVNMWDVTQIVPEAVNAVVNVQCKLRKCGGTTTVTKWSAAVAEAFESLGLGHLLGGQ